MWQLADPKILWLAILPLAAALYFLFRRRSSQRRELIQLSDQGGILLEQARRTRRLYRLFFVLTLLALCLLLYTMAEPVRLKTWAKKSTEGVDIAILLDVSDSMEAEDLKPTRILAAKSVIRSFVSHRPNDRIGLIIFGGEAILKCPLTRDFDFLLSQVDDVKLHELKQGTAIGMGLSNAILRLRRSVSKNRIIILLTDGDSNVGAINPITAAHLAAQEGIRVYTIGIGKADRVVVPIYAYDAYGNKTQVIAQVPSYLNPELLRQIARITGGKAYMARDTGMLSRILDDIDKLEKTKIILEPRAEKQDMSFLPAFAATLLLALLYLLQETRFQKARLRHAV